MLWSEQCHRVLRERRLRLRNTDAWSACTDEEFVALFRFNKSMCKQIIELISPHIADRKMDRGISKETRILLALRFFATGSYQRPVGQDFHLGTSQPCVSRAIHEVTDAIISHLGEQYICFPEESERAAIKLQFYEKFAMPGVIGIVDGTHISIKKPSANVEHVYYAVRKARHTKNVQIVCDFDLKIRGINTRFGGSTHDSFVFNNSALKTMLNEEYNSQRLQNSWLLGKQS